VLSNRRLSGAGSTPPAKDIPKDNEVVNEEPLKKNDKETTADAGVLDLVFAMDCTASMGSYIANAQQHIAKIVERIVASEKVGCAQ
jgi:hypothetical protein